MNEKYKELWVKGLRSGEYKQGCGKLKTEITDVVTHKVDVFHCCLGVLGEIINNENPLISLTSNESVRVNLNGGWLKDNVAISLGLSWEQQTTLSTMNDGLGGEHRKTFNEIADYIEKEL